jgi:hypothetical protein
MNAYYTWYKIKIVVKKYIYLAHDDKLSMKNINFNNINQLTLYDIADMESLEKDFFIGALGFIYYIFIWL